MWHKCTPQNTAFSSIWLIAIIAEATKNECIIERHLGDFAIHCEDRSWFYQNGLISTIWLSYKTLISILCSSLSVRPSIYHSWSMPKWFNIIEMMFALYDGAMLDAHSLFHTLQYAELVNFSNKIPKPDGSFHINSTNDHCSPLQKVIIFGYVQHDCKEHVTQNLSILAWILCEL